MQLFAQLVVITVYTFILCVQEVAVCISQGRIGGINIDCFLQKVLPVWLTAISS